MQNQKLSFKFIVALICINLTIPPTMLFADPSSLGTDTSMQPEVSADEPNADSAVEAPSDPWEDGAISEATPSLDEVVQSVINEHFPHGMISVQREKGTTANGNEYDFTVFDHQNYGSASHFKADGTMSEFEPSEEHLIEMQRQADESAMQSTESENSANTEEAEAPGSEESSPAEETTDTSDPFSAETDDRPLSEMDEEEKQEMYGPFLEALEELEQARNEADQSIEDAASQNDGNDSSVPAAEDTASTEAPMPETPATEVMPTEEPAANTTEQEEFNEEEFLSNWDMENPAEEFNEDMSFEDYFGSSDDASSDWEDEEYFEEDYSDYSEDTTMYGNMDYQNYSDPMSTGTDQSGSESTGQVPTENYAADRTDPKKDAKYDPQEAKERREKRKQEKEQEKKAKEEAERKWWEEAREKQKRDAAEREAAKQRALAEARARAAAAQNGGAR